MKLRDWKDGLRIPRAAAVEKSAFSVERFGVIEPSEPSAVLLRLSVVDLAKRTKLSVEATTEAGTAMRALGHPGGLLIEKDKDIFSDSIKLMFYGVSGEGERVKQVFEARRIGTNVEIIITPFRPSEVYGLMHESDSTITNKRLYDACLKDLRMLRGWPPETEFEAKRWLEKGVEGQVIFRGGSGRARADLLFNATLSPSGKFSATLPLFPHIHLQIPMSVIEKMT